MRAPSAPKSAPYEIKSALKPATKSAEPKKTLPRACENPAANESVYAELVHLLHFVHP